MGYKNCSYAWIQYFVKTLSLKSLWRRTCFIALGLSDIVSSDSLDVQLKTFKYFCWEEKLYLWQEKRDNVKIIDWKERYIFLRDHHCDYVYVSTCRHLYEVRVFNYMLHVMSAGELNLNAIYAKHPALKSVYEKSQSVMSGKLFSSYSPIGQCLN